MKKSVLYMFLWCVLSASVLFAGSINWFTPETFGKPFISDIRSSIIKFEEGFINDLGDYYYLPNYDRRPITEGHVGTDIPLLSYRRHLAGGYLKATALLTGSFNLFMDSLEPTNRMVLNTDYWMGTEIRSVFYHPAIEKTGLRNIGLQIMPVFHESTHLGDEFVMRALEESSDFYRVNVSYESWRVSLTLNDPDTLK
ncbi:MAG: DUF1207 domain-containing protein [Candidatus Marinimicrobia bacterium]|nr:DUF1207 domain-containing protein [Candidatus Neomarinimicrobiota bacterium]